MKIAFHAGHLNYRGTTVALYDYAHFNETILGNKSIILANLHEDLSHYSRFAERFQVFFYDNISQIDPILKREAADAFYMIKGGKKDEIISKVVKNLVHCIYEHLDPHGDVYAYISAWQSQNASSGKYPYVPLIVQLPEVHENLREILKIPEESIVFGRHGGDTQFSIPFVKKAVIKYAKENKNTYFLFLNTRKFNKHWPNKNLSNIIFLPSTPEIEFKVKFINTCDVMLHARDQGEAFGLAICEFLHQDKPVITWTDSRDKAHLEILGSKGIYYKDQSELNRILFNFRKISNDGRFKSCIEEFSPKNVMKKFAEVFLRI